MNQHDKCTDRSDDQRQPPERETPHAESDEDWVADVKRWYHERTRGVDVAKRQEVQKGLQ